MYTDLLTKIKNAQTAKKETLKVPFSNMDMAILDLLVKNQYIEGAQKKGRLPKRIIEIKLRYTNDGGAIQGIKFLSTPSRRLHKGYKELHKVRQGYGALIISTSQGIMTGTEARKQKMGGVLLFEIW